MFSDSPSGVPGLLDPLLPTAPTSPSQRLQAFLEEHVPCQGCRKLPDLPWPKPAAWGEVCLALQAPQAGARSPVASCPGHGALWTLSRVPASPPPPPSNPSLPQHRPRSTCDEDTKSDKPHVHSSVYIVVQTLLL
jgi:hypothetical protein